MKKISVALLFAIISASSGIGYRFICNGLLANGEERADECGLCDDKHAARWKNPNLGVVVDDSPLPQGINKSDWQAVTKESFAAWEKVDGSDLRFFQIPSKNVREFGANESLHEIFWITNKEEWRRLVGSGEFGTLGATLPRYTCGDDAGAPREIFDADLVLNGMPHINWQVSCNDEDCISIQTTLVHELGHFFGLDHPCLMCSSSIMSARAGFDLIYPVYDDMEGLRVLYPNSSKGGFGFPCITDSDCSDRNLCINDGPNRYCSSGCKEDDECDLGSICKESGGNKVCAFIDGESAGGRKEGENCTRIPCVEPMVCAGASEPNYFCFMPCQSNATCERGQSCVKLEDDLSICVTIKDKGDLCDHRELCEEHLYCLLDDENSGYCRATCKSTYTASSGCPMGEVCQLIEDGVELCVPPQGNLALGDGSDGFGQEEHEGSFGRVSTEDQEAKVKSGCQSLLPDKSNDISWLALLLLWAMRGIRWPHRKALR